jgi:isopentenyl-diphosphate delta-isomerase
MGKEFVILVDKDDQEQGVMEKMMAHEKGALHRAFSIFIFNSENELLIHQRALEKYHSGGLWTNTCCSHQRPDESTERAANRRLQEEMGMTCKMNPVFSFIYKAQLDNSLTEHEFDHVLLGKSDDLPNVNPDEVADFKYMSLETISADILLRPNAYTEWFKICLMQNMDKIKSALFA